MLGRVWGCELHCKFHLPKCPLVVCLDQNLPSYWIGCHWSIASTKNLLSDWSSQDSPKLVLQNSWTTSLVTTMSLRCFWPFPSSWLHAVWRQYHFPSTTKDFSDLQGDFGVSSCFFVGFSSWALIVLVIMHETTMSQKNTQELKRISIRVFPKIVVPPNHHFYRVFHYFHHPFWGTRILGNTHHSITLIPHLFFAKEILAFFLAPLALWRASLETALQGAPDAI